MPDVESRAPQDTEDLADFSATIVSHMFWPKPDQKDKEKVRCAHIYAYVCHFHWTMHAYPLPPGPYVHAMHAQELEAKLQLPTEIGSMMKRYGEQYSALKTPRQLRWRPHQGVVGSPPCAASHACAALWALLHSLRDSQCQGYNCLTIPV